MKTNRLYVLTAERGVSLHSKIFVVSIIIALIFAVLQAASVFAAPASVTESNDLDKEWRDKIRNVHYNNLFYNGIQLLPADFEDPDELAEARAILDKYGAALRQANNIIATHAGFDFNGEVTDETLAAKSVADVAENLRIMRAWRLKFELGDYKVQRIR